MVGWHHRLNGYEFEQTPGDNEGQESLAYCSPWDCRVKDDLMAEQQQQTSGFFWGEPQDFWGDFRIFKASPNF